MNHTSNESHHIFVVDDNPKNIQIIGALLRKSGFEISVALSGTQALEIITKNKPDLILLDIMMPVMDGYEVCSRIQKNSEIKDIPVIFLSALTDTIDKVQGFKVGAVDYVTKPIDSLELLARINLHLTLRNLQKKLEDANYSLEDKVKIRTRELLTKQKNLEIEIEEHKKTQIELNATKNSLTNIINSMPSILIGVDENCVLTHWNLIAEKETGISSDSAMGRDVFDVFKQIAAIKTELLHSINTRIVQKVEKISQQKGRETIISDVTIYPLVSNGISGAVIRIDDVTDRVRMEEMMIQGEKMLSIGGLAAGMAHEINNPLAGMMQTANVMANRLGAKVDLPANLKAAEEAGTTIEAIWNFMEARGIPRMITTINESGRRVANIVDNMLSFAHKSDSAVSPQDLNGLLDKTLDLAAIDYDLKKQYDFKQIEIRKEYEAHLPSLNCESAKIQQVLLNILRNGAQAMQKAGTEKPMLIIRTRFEKKRKMVCVEIEDNGPGMDKENRRRAFEPFYTTKPKGIGTGLGLSVSYFIITENHGGEMVVESLPNFGSKFIIRLPVENGKA